MGDAAAPKPNMNYSNMIEEKNLKKGFIIATLISTIVGTFTASMTLHDKFQEKQNKKEQKQRDSTQDSEIKELKEKLDSIESHTKEIKNHSERSRSGRSRYSGSSSQSRSRSRSDERRRGRHRKWDASYDEDDAYMAYKSPRQQSRAGLERAYMDELLQLAPGYMRGDLESENLLQARLVELQHALDEILGSNHSLSKPELDHIVAAQNAAERLLAERRVLSSRKLTFDPLPVRLEDYGALGKPASSPFLEAATQGRKGGKQARIPPPPPPYSSLPLRNDRPVTAPRPQWQSEDGKLRQISIDPGKQPETQSTKTVVSGRTVKPGTQFLQPDRLGDKAVSTKTLVSGKSAKGNKRDRELNQQNDQALSTKAILFGKPAKTERRPSIYAQKSGQPPNDQHLDFPTRASVSFQQDLDREDACRRKGSNDQVPDSAPVSRENSAGRVGAIPHRKSSTSTTYAANLAPPLGFTGAAGMINQPRREQNAGSLKAKESSPGSQPVADVADRVETQYLSKRRNVAGSKRPVPEGRSNEFYAPVQVPAVEPSGVPRSSQPKAANAAPLTQKVPAPPTDRKALPEPPPRSVYCRYSQDLQVNGILPLHSSLRTSGNHRCPRCNILVPVDTRDVWVLSTHDPVANQTRDYRMDARFVVKCHTPEGDFACLLCSKSRRPRRILSDWEKLVEHLGTEHGPAEFENDIDFVRMPDGRKLGGVKVKAGGKEMLLTR